MSGTTQGNAGKTREELDLAMMKDRDSWPCWPVLPIKRWHNGQRELATLCEGRYTPKFGAKLPTQKGEITLVYAGMYELWNVSTKREVMDTKDWPEQLIAAGWTVD